MILTRKETLLVTGAAGFIGSYVCELALARGYKVIALDNLSYGSNKDNIPPGVILLRGSITDYALVKDIFYSEPIHKVVNLAALSHVDHAIKDSSEFMRTNSIGVQVLLEAIRQISPTTRFLQVSTDECLGELRNEGEMFTEDTRHNPLNLYAVSKSSGELLARGYSLTYGADIVTTACSNNIGARQADDKLIPKLVKAALKNEPLTLYGEGKERRDWLSVSDHAEGIMLALEKGKSGEKYMFGSGTTMSNFDVAQAVIKVTASASEIQFIPSRVTHDFMYCVDASKAKHNLGWKQTKSFEEALADVVQEGKK